jgi:hypothetical protein
MTSILGRLALSGLAVTQPIRSHSAPAPARRRQPLVRP